MSKQFYILPVTVCRKISSSEDESKGIKIYAGQAPITSFLTIPDEENVRRYTMEANERKKRSGVHRAIEDTLTNNPEKFMVLNGGICLIAENIELSKNQKNIKLHNANIINGSQTRGVIRDYIEQLKQQSRDLSQADLIPNVKFEIIISNDKELVAECSISRNNQIPVSAISILGKREVFKDLNDRVKKAGKKPLRISETDRGDDFEDTEKLLQIIAALIPKQLWEATGRGKNKSSYAKAFAYNGKASCLRLFEKVFNEANGKVSNAEKKLSEDLYKFYLDIAPDALKLYEKWNSGKLFNGANFKQEEAIVRDKDTREIRRAHDGVIFPIIAAHSVFIKKNDKGNWQMVIPDIKIDDLTVDENLVAAAKATFISVANHKPHIMGKTEACYEHIRLFTQTFSSVLSAAAVT